MDTSLEGSDISLSDFTESKKGEMSRFNFCVRKIS